MEINAAMQKSGTTEQAPKKIVFSAVKPTGSLTIGNYIGAIRNMAALQEEYDCVYSVADLHSITVSILPADLRKNSMELTALFLAMGIDADKSTFFVQSHITAHAQLTWLLNCYTQFGEASRMTQFKDKSKKAPQNVNVGLFDYPVLMAADILLYQTDLVPVGKDQLQHVELARTVAERFNNRYSPTFKLPEGMLPKYGAKVYSLANPAVKMSKTDTDPNGYVLVLDKPDDVVRKLKRAVTDSDTTVRYAPEEKPGVSNLLTVYSAFTGKDMRDCERDFDGKDYAYFKSQVADAVIAGLTPVQEKFKQLSADKQYLFAVMRQGAERAARRAEKTLSKVYRKIGFVLPD